MLRQMQACHVELRSAWQAKISWYDCSISTFSPFDVSTYKYYECFEEKMSQSSRIVRSLHLFYVIYVILRGSRVNTSAVYIFSTYLLILFGLVVGTTVLIDLQ